MDIKPIETVYNGYRFRSRLEARWAVFFDVLGVKYEYEPEGFDLQNGEYYLPDFRVQCYGIRGDNQPPAFPLYIEVKGNMTEEDARRIRRFSGIKEYHERLDEFYEAEGRGEKDLSEAPQRTAHPVLVVGNIPGEGSCTDSYDLKAYDRMNGIEIYPFNYELIDGDYFAAYPAADKNGHFYLMGDDSNYVNNEDIPRIENAYRKARQARFEHGEKPLSENEKEKELKRLNEEAKKYDKLAAEYRKKAELARAESNRIFWNL